MLNQQPIYILIISIFMLIISIVDIFYNEKQEKFTLFGSLFLFIINIVCVFLYETKIQTQESLLKIFNIYVICVYIVFFLFFIKIFLFSISKMRQYYLITSSIKKTKWNAYYVVDQKNKIKDISEPFLQQLNLKLEDVKGKNIFDIFDKSIRFLKFNGVEITNKEVKKFYVSYKKSIKINTIDKRELIIQNAHGEQVIINLVEQPIFYFNKYKGRICVGEIKTDFNMLNVEKEVLDLTDELNSIKNKFSATFELITMPLIYYDLNEKYIWGNDAFKELIQSKSNTILIDEFVKLIQSDDLKKYHEMVQNFSVEKPSQSIKYRIIINHKPIWVKESIKRIYENKNENMMVSILEVINNDHYIRTNMPVLDNILSYNDLIADLQKIMEYKRPFYVVYFRLNNIPNLNEDYSREFGNMAMSEYIKKMKLNFASDLSNIYRIGGIDFVLTITDYRKMDLLKKALTTDFDSLNLKVTYGAIDEKVRIILGISTGLKDTDNPKRLVEIAKEAFKIALKENYKHDYCFSEEL